MVQAAGRADQPLARAGRRATLYLANSPLGLFLAAVFIALITGVIVVLGAIGAPDASAQGAEPDGPTSIIDLPSSVREMVVDGADRPVWDSAGTLYRCADPTCASFETSRLTGRAIVHKLLVAPDGGVVVIGWRLSDSPTEDGPAVVEMLWCQPGPEGFCDRTASDHAVLRESQLERTKFFVYDALFDAAENLVLVAASDSDSIVFARCLDVRCSALERPAVTLQAQVPNEDVFQRPRLMLSDDGLPFVVVVKELYGAPGNPVVVIACRDRLCERRNVNAFPAARFGFDTGASVGLLGAEVATIGNQRPILVLGGVAPLSENGDRPTGAIHRVVDCRTFICSSPQARVLETEATSGRSTRSPSAAINDQGALVLFGQGFVSVCGDSTCADPGSTVPVLAVVDGRSSNPSAPVFASEGRPVLAWGSQLVLCSSRTCVSPGPVVPVITLDCVRAGDDAAMVVDVDLANLSDEPVTYEIRTGAVERTVVVPARQPVIQTERITGRPDGPLVVVVARDGVDVISRAESVACAAPPNPRAGVACVGGEGRIDVAVAATEAELPSTFDVVVGNFGRTVALTEEDLGGLGIGPGSPRRYPPNRFVTHATALATVSPLADGVYNVVVAGGASGQVVLRTELSVSCGGGQPSDGLGMQAVSVVSSCLNGNGRVDVTVVERSSQSGDWSVAISGLSPRERRVGAGDWWRLPVTGRSDGIYLIDVSRDGVVVAEQAVEVSCDHASPLVSVGGPVVTSACRDGRGYVLFQFVNDSAVARSWVLEFDGVPNRSTSATAWGTSVRAVTGRPNGVYVWNVRGEPIKTVMVSC